MAALPEIRYEIGLVIRYKTSCYKEAAAGEGTKSEMVRHAHRFGTSRRDPSGFQRAESFWNSRRRGLSTTEAVVSSSFPSRRKSLWVPAPPVKSLQTCLAVHSSPSIRDLSEQIYRILLGDIPAPLPGIGCLTSRDANAGLTIPEYKKRRGQHAFGDIRPTMSYCCLRIALYVRVASLCGGRSNE